ncbi:MAG: hypothetical protein PWQ35_461 [Patescibacteria group bacterium]|nr:hypothetical protein [Patescibacteria group bacterium]
MKKIVFVLLVILLSACGKKNQNEVVVTENCCEELRIEIARLQERVNFLEKIWEANNAQAVEVTLTAPTKVSAPTPKVSASKSTPKKVATKTKTTPVSTPTPSVSAPVTKPTKTSVSISGTPGIANLDYLRQGGEIIFCVRVNKREDMYFPHFAKNHGVRFSNPIVENQIKGYNFLVEPTEGFQGDYGVTTRGVFFISNSLIVESLRAGGVSFENWVEIKAPFTNWELRPMTRSGDYWIFSTQ